MVDDLLGKCGRCLTDYRDKMYNERNEIRSCDDSWSWRTGSGRLAFDREKMMELV